MFSKIRPLNLLLLHSHPFVHLFDIIPANELSRGTFKPVLVSHLVKLLMLQFITET